MEGGTNTVAGGLSKVQSQNRNALVTLKADLGSVVVENSVFRDCAVEINALVSKVELTHVMAVAHHGHTPVMIHNDKGAVYLNQVLASSLWVTSVDGTIFAGRTPDGVETIGQSVHLAASSYRLGQLKVGARALLSWRG